MRKINKEEFSKIIQFANREFNVDMREIQPTLYNDSENYKYHYVYEMNKEIVGMFLAKPLVYNNIKFLGIGTLCVKREYRNRGIMKEMFVYMEEELFPNYDLIYLSGDRIRYERFGFYEAGVCYNVKIKNKNLNEKTIDLNKLTEKNINIQNIIFQNYVVKREINDFNNLLMDKNINIFLFNDDRDYLIYDVEDKTILEINSNIDYKVIFKSMMNKLGLTWINFDCNELFMKKLTNVIYSFNVSCIANFRIMNYKKIIDKFEKEKYSLSNLCEKDRNYHLIRNGLNNLFYQNIPVTIASIDSV